MTSNATKPHLSEMDLVLRKEKKVLGQLDLVHERALVGGESGLHHANGKRLKVESPRPTKRKRALPTEYHISFTDLSSTTSNSRIELPEEVSDSDDLPEAVLPNETAAEKTKIQKEGLKHPSRGSEYDSTSRQPTKTLNHGRKDAGETRNKELVMVRRIVVSTSRPCTQ